MTVRRRLIIAVSVTTLIVLGSIAALLVILRSSLGNELDKQVVSATRELVERADQSAADQSSPAPDLLAGLVVTDLAGDRPTDPFIGAVSGDQPPRLAPEVIDAHATDRSAPIEPFDAVADGDQRVRAAAVRVTDGRVVVAALSTAHIDATLRRVAIGSAVVGGALLAAMTLVAWWVERLGLRPIRRVAAAADAIASGDTSRRVASPPSGTEAGHLARAFNVMVDERQGAEERLRQFVADASHELRTPLTTISGVCQLVQSGALAGPDLEEAIRRAASEATRMTSLVEDLLLLTQLDHARPLADDEVDLARLVRDAALDIGVIQPERPLTVHADAVAVVRGDEARLRQVVANLVSNALVHTPPASAVHLAVERANDAVVMVVGDNGPGLTADQAAHIFDRFYRVTPGRSRRAGGTGLGLSIVRSIVAAHHGSVSVSAASGGGCEFRVVLPADLQRTSRSPSANGETRLSPSPHDQPATTSATLDHNTPHP